MCISTFWNFFLLFYQFYNAIFLLNKIGFMRFKNVFMCWFIELVSNVVYCIINLILFQIYFYIGIFFLKINCMYMNFVENYIISDNLFML